MTTIQLTKISENGQIKIPEQLRQQLKLKKGETFAITHNQDTLLLKRIKTTTQEETLKKLKQFTKETKKTLKKLKIKENQVPTIIHKNRGIDKP